MLKNEKVIGVWLTKYYQYGVLNLPFQWRPLYFTIILKMYSKVTSNINTLAYHERAQINCNKSL
jgi:hypothetical protein